MNTEVITGNMHALLERFFQPGQAEIIIGTLVVWLLLRRTLPVGSGYVLKQTITFFTLCLLGQFAAAVFETFGWPMAATGLYEVTLLGVGVALIRFGGLLLFRVVMPLLKFNTPRIIEDITVILGYCVWLMVRLRFAGLDLSNIVATSAVLTAISAFAMQDTLGNILGGLAIHLDHSVEIGDWVIADGISGRVIDIRWRYTKIATRNGEKVVMPNSQLMKNKFTVVGVYSEDNASWRRQLGFNVGFEHAPGKVIAIAERAIKEAEITNVARAPLPSCVLMEFDAGFSHYVLRYWLTDPMYDDPTDSAVRQHLIAALQREAVDMAIPSAERRIVKENEAHGKAHFEHELARRIDALNHVAVLQMLSADEKKNLVLYLTHAPFARGDVITRQGAVADWLYVLVAGEVDVWVEQQGERQLLSTLPAGSVFGEMGLMTGAPRSATVIAKTDVDCYRLGKEGLDALMRARPSIAEEVSHVLAAREVELEQARSSLDKSVQEKHIEHHETILGRIRDFFKLTT